MNRYLDPKNDIAFKKVFGTEAHKPLLIEFLNACLHLEGEDTITDLSYLTPEQTPFVYGEKYSIVDVKCRDQKDHQFIVEMQNKTVPEFVKRVQHYAAHSYASQLQQGDRYTKLKPIVLFAIVNHNLFQKDAEKELVSQHKTLNIRTLKQELTGISYAFMNLLNAPKKPQECHTLEQKWMYVLKHVTKEKEPAFQDAHIMEAYTTLEQFNWTADEYDCYVQSMLRQQTEVAAEEEKYNKEKEEGEKVGLEKGEKKAKLKIAQTMLAEGLSVDKVEKMTGLTKEEIREKLVR